MRLSKPVTTFIDPITPIWNPVSSKLCISSSWTPYLALVSSTSLNHALITSGSSCCILWRSFTQFQAILSSSKRVINLPAHCLPTGFPPRASKSLSAISATSHSRGANPRASRSRMYWTIVCSLVRVSFLQFGAQSRRPLVPLTRRQRV